MIKYSKFRFHFITLTWETWSRLKKHNILRAGTFIVYIIQNIHLYKIQQLCTTCKELRSRNYFHGLITIFVAYVVNINSCQPMLPLLWWHYLLVFLQFQSKEAPLPSQLWTLDVTQHIQLGSDNWQSLLNKAYVIYSQ